MTDKNVDLGVQFGPLKLANPIMTASGTCGYAFELRDFVDMDRLGAYITKSITLEPRMGNKPQRTYEVASGMMNAIGLANVGLDKFIEEKIPLLEKMNVPVIVNVAGKEVPEYVKVAKEVSAQDCVAGLELNVSCPNVKEGGISFGTDPKLIQELVGSVRQACPDTFLIVKLTPNVTDITVPARAAIDAGANALSLINTFMGLAIDAEKRKPILANRTGGVSGPAVKPMALHMVNRVYNEVAKDAGIPILGMGGITNATDAIEFILAGATGISVGTNVLINPGCLNEIEVGLKEYLIRHHETKLSDLIGKLK
ncbi:MAG: dihydroorotate dehydrogenase [Phycisphaerae bacterium]|nr:dihydroorotate dehydrogenase [Phycisphaerae bacterium]